MLRVLRPAGRLLLASLALWVGAAAVIHVPTSAEPDDSFKVTRKSYTRTVEPSDPENPPLGPPAVDLTAACVREVPGGYEAVFGYDNPGDTSVLVGLGDERNLLLRVIEAGPVPAVSIEEFGPQVTLFKPGRHPHAFAARFDSSERIAWQVAVPSTDGVSSFRVTVNPRPRVDCGRPVPNEFAVVQNVDISAGPTNVAIEPPFQIVGYEIEFRPVNVRAVCSAGGELVDVEEFVGWPQGMNVEPLEPGPDYYVDVGNTRFEMTTTTLRSVARVSEKVEWRGPIVDATAYCAFGDKIVASDVFWGERAGHGARVDPEIDDSGNVVGLSQTENAPVGSRIR